MSAQHIRGSDSTSLVRATFGSTEVTASLRPHSAVDAPTLIHEYRESRQRQTGGDRISIENPSTELSKPVEKPYVVHFEDFPTRKVVEMVEGEVEKILDDEATVVFKMDNGFDERIIPVRFLKARGAGYEGARIRMTVTESEGTLVSRIEKLVDRPYWATPDEQMMQVFRELEDAASDTKKKLAR